MYNAHKFDDFFILTKPAVGMGPDFEELVATCDTWTDCIEKAAVDHERVTGRKGDCISVTPVERPAVGTCEYCRRTTTEDELTTDAAGLTRCYPHC